MIYKILNSETFAVFLPVIFAVFMIFISFIKVMIREKGKSKNNPPSGQAAASKKAATVPKAPAKAGTFPVNKSFGSGAAASKAGSKGVNSLHESFKDLEDRNNDWLAKQLREEKALGRKISAMYSLKQTHADNCDARNVRDAHSRNCDAEGIDRGTA